MQKICLLSLAIFFSLSSTAQLFGGFGYSYASPTSSARDDFNGYALTLQKDLRQEKKIQLIISASASVMNDEFDDGPSILGATSNNLSFAILGRKKLNITENWSASIFLGPFVSWLWYFRPGNIVLDEIYINSSRVGLEGGIMTTFSVGDKVNLRFIPLHIQADPQDFRHGMMSVLISWQ
jgi:hypothetical protein